MVSFFCRARSALKRPSLQSTESKANSIQLMESIHSPEAIDLCENPLASKADNQGEPIELGSHQVKGDHGGYGHRA